MLRSKLMIWVAVLVLLVAGAGCAADLERTVEETITILEQPTGETILDLEQPAGETDGFTITGWVTVDAYHYDEATGTYVHFYHDESSNVITTIGLNFIEEHLGIGTATNDDPAKWISLSNDGGSAASWTELPIEINANGMTRAEGAYESTGDGIWTITKTFTATGAVTVQTTGLQWLVTPVSDLNLMAANDFTSVILATDDSLTITWTITLNP
ncbi:hypothetical protein ES703_66654 [subsurface metagenome]